ncbi:uncharacterized protein LOC125658420 [Ostrea edulis]|uniref:uncharacterized protein LOC125658420 n=1 Tax=Ostrea edulis TaxID=37623 RepID=UPI0024AFD291|nr:uncharacterized protein LOC125658420 [Ostrea edulis]
MSDKISAIQRKSLISFRELDVDTEIELGNLSEFEGSGMMSSSDTRNLYNYTKQYTIFPEPQPGNNLSYLSFFSTQILYFFVSGADNPCVDRTFVGQTLYRCLGDFMKEAYVAKIEQRQIQPKKMCMLFEDGFQCFEKKLQRDNGDMCTAHDLYDIASWFKTEIFTDFDVDVRGCPYPDVPPTPVPSQTSGHPVFTDVRESSQVALVAGIVLGVAVMSILVMIFFVIFKRRIIGASTDCHESHLVKKKTSTAPPPESTLPQQCHVNVTDTHSTLTGLGSDHSVHHGSYESVPAHRASSHHIYTEIDSITEKPAGHMDDVTRVAPIGCPTFMSGYMPPDLAYQWQHGAPHPVKDMTVDYVATGGYYTHTHAPVYQSTTVPL